MEKIMNYLDRNEFNFEPSQKVVDAINNFDPKTLCFYTRIYDEGKKLFLLAYAVYAWSLF